MSPKTLNILQVEDDETDRILFARAVQRSGLLIYVAAATSGQEALRFLQASFEPGATAPDYVLLDIRMPMMSGFEFLQIIKGMPRLRELKVIMFSSSVYHADVSRARELGANAYVVKPSSLSSLSDFVRSLYDCWVRASVPDQWPDARSDALCP